MVESHTSPYVFLSYARADNEMVTRLRNDLLAQGIRVWIDREGIPPGHPDWESALREAIRAANAVLFIATPSARNSRHVKDELRIAEMYQRPIYPLWAEGEQWMEAVPLGLGGTQHIDIREERYLQGMQKLVTHLLNETQKSRTSASFLPPDTGSPLRNPYKGLRAFRSEDAGDFFGRSSLIAELVEAVRGRLAPDQHSGSGKRLLTVIGPSGSGKSSVVMAGLIPQLQQGRLPGSQEWVYIEPMKPGQHPIEALAQVLSPLFSARSLKTIREELEDESTRGLHFLLASLLASLMKRPETKTVLLIDQFEELFTQTTSEDERKHFFELLLTAVTEPEGPLLVVLTLRADFYDRPMQYPSLYNLLDEHRVTVLPMEREDLRRVIEGPAQLPDVQMTFEGDLVGDLLFEIRGQNNALPLLQFTLDQLFALRKGHLITLQAYREIGGVKGALAKHAEETYADLPSQEHRKLAQTLFVRLIDPGATQQDATRRRAILSEFLLQDTRLTQLLQETMDFFIAARLLTINKVADTTTIEVSHEALIREWARCDQWLQETRENLPFQQTLGKDVAQWEQLKRPKERLYHGFQLKMIKKRVDRSLLNQQEMLFLSESTVYQRQQNIRMIAMILLPVIILTLVTSPILVFRPFWCPSWLCPAPQPLIAKAGVHDSNLQVNFQALQSSLKILSDAPSTYTLANLPSNPSTDTLGNHSTTGDVQLINTSQVLPYRVVLKIHSLQQGPLGLVIEQVTLVVTRQAQVIPYPLRVYIANNVSTYNNNLYQITYRGQAANAILYAFYVAQPLAHVSLLPGETDEISLEVRSTVVADLHFQVQVTYEVLGQSTYYTLTLPNVFEIIFSDPANWHPYQFQNGQLVATS